MPSNWKKMTCFAMSLPNRPGELARYAAQLRDAGINLLGLWSYEPGRAETRISCVPESAAAFRHFFRASGLEIEEGVTFYLREIDTPGALIDALNAIAEAGINIEAIEAVSCGERFGCFLWAEAAQLDDLEQVLMRLPAAS